MAKYENYLFLGENYKSKHDLAVAFVNNFGDAVNYIYTESFLQQFRDPYFRGCLEVELKRAKYVESALAMIIYHLDPDLGICIKGNLYHDLEELAQFMAETSYDPSLSIMHFFEDHCLTHILQNKDLDIETKRHISYVEDNIYQPAMYGYFVNMFVKTLDEREAINNFLYQVKVANDPFYTFSNVSNHPIVLSALFTKFGLDVISALDNDPLKPFTLIDLLFTGKENNLILNTILNSGLDLWLARNYKKYNFRGIASNLEKLYKEYTKNEAKYTIEEKIEMRKKVYLSLNNFLILHDAGYITTKDENYKLTQVYDKVRAPKAYFDNCKIKDYTSAELPILNKNEKKEILSSIKIEFKKDENIIKEDKKNNIQNIFPSKMNKILNGRTLSLILAILVSLAGAFVLIYTKAFKGVSYIFEELKYTILIAVPLLFLLSLILLVRNLIQQRQLKIYYLEDENPDEYYLSTKELKTREYKKAYRKYEFYGFLVYLLYVCVVFFFAYAVTRSKITDFEFVRELLYKGKAPTYPDWIDWCLLFGPVYALGTAFATKKKGRLFVIATLVAGLVGLVGTLVIALF